MAFIYAVYLDVLIMENALLDCAGLISVGLWCKLRIRWWKIGLGTLFGVALGIICFFQVNIFWVYLVLVFGVVNPLMLQIAYGWFSPRQLLGCYLRCVVLNLFLGGMMNLLRQMLPENWYHYMLPVACILLLPVVVALELLAKKQKGSVEVSILVNGTVKRMIALRDTGNLLLDPLTGQAVCIVSEELLNEVGLSQDTLRRISYETVAGRDHITVYPASKFFVRKKDKMMEYKGIMLGFANKSLFEGKKYQMILHNYYC